MSIGHVTYYFATKRELLIRAITLSEQTFQQEVGAELERHDDPWQRVRTLIELASASGPRDRGWLLWFEVWANAAVDDEVALTQRRLDGWWRETLAAVVADGTARGVFEPPDTERATWAISGLTDGLSVQLALGAPSLTRKKLISTVLEVAAGVLTADQRPQGWT
jgi:AcrR family transcriptional regulator